MTTRGRLDRIALTLDYALLTRSSGGALALVPQCTEAVRAIVEK
jgi:hypothetical protein